MRSFTKQYQGDHTKEEEMHVTFSIYRYDKCTQNCHQNTWWEETTCV